jgi:hypothetical protein
VALRVVRDHVTLGEHPIEDLRDPLVARLHHLTNQEEDRLEVVLLEDVEHLRCGHRVRAVVERQHELDLTARRFTRRGRGPPLGSRVAGEGNRE